MADVCMWTKIWRSGAGWHSQMVGQAIAAAGASIVYISPAAEPASREPNHPNLTRILVPRELVGRGTRMQRILASVLRMVAGAAAAIAQRPRTRVYLLTIPEPLPFTLPIMLILRLTGARIIFQVHDAKPHAWRAPPWLRFFERGAHALSYRLSTHLVCLTEPTRRSLIDDFGCSAARITVIPHGPFELPEATPLPGNGHLLIFGSLRRNKNILVAIEGVIAARQAGHPVRLVLAGEPLAEEGAYWSECLAAIARDPDGFDVRPGYVAESDIPALIAGSDAFVLAYGNFASQSGVGVLAAVAGRPVIGTRAGGLADLYQQGMTGPQIDGAVSADSVAAAIAEFCATPIAGWQALSSEGSRRVKDALSWDRIGADYVRLIRSLQGHRQA